MILIDKIDEIILEMTFLRSLAIKKIHSIQDTLNIHLIKLLKFDDKQNYNKHLNDVDAWFRSINRIKIKGNKRFSHKQYFQFLFKDLFTSIKDVQNVTDIIEDELKDYFNNHQSIRTDKEIIKIIFDIHKLSSVLLSKGKLNNFKQDIWCKVIK